MGRWIDGAGVSGETGTDGCSTLPKTRKTETHSTKNQETKAGKTGVGGVFSNAGDFGEKSLFNKEKWLPLATEAPYLISHYCCAINKKKPLKAYQKAHGKPYIATLADESRIRKQAWIRHGCNVFDGKDPKSQPLSFWLEQDILAYIARYNLDIASVYGDVVSVDEDGNEYAASFTGAAPLKTTGVDRTGCIFCLFGAHAKDDRRFVLLKQTHPKHYDYCMRGGQWIGNPHYVPDAPEYDGEWKNWNPQKIWVPGNGGLGMSKVIDIFNDLYPNNQILY